MFDYEFGRAGCDLDETKEKLKTYLVESYKYRDDPSDQADVMFKLLEIIVDRIIKRKEYRINFGEGGSPLWHANIYSYLSKWIEAELKMCEMLSKEINSKLED